MQTFNQGNSFDRSILSLLIIVAVGILVWRSFKWISWLAANPLLSAFLVFACVSVLWSDDPIEAFKRWIRDFGSYAMICVVLTDRRPAEAIQVVFRRLGYLFVSLSIVLIKYFPALSITYNEWTGARMVDGVTTSKNDLGAVCMISGIFFLWDTLTLWADRKQRKVKQAIALNLTFLFLSVWLLYSSHSTTSTICFLLGSAVVLATRLQLFKRHPGILKVSIPAIFFLYLILSFGFGLAGSMAQAVGKDPTLTDRTKIWAIVLGMHTNPIIGTGYESFWLGQRLDWFWRFSGQGQLNEAHNGYLEVYLELGLIGDALICGLIATSYRRIGKMLSKGESIAAFSLALWMVLVFYNMTEAAFEGTFVFVVFLVGTMRIPARGSGRQLQSVRDKTDEPKGLPFATAWQQKSSAGNAFFRRFELP
jgi:O-antigen ligase